MKITFYDVSDDYRDEVTFDNLFDPGMIRIGVARKSTGARYFVKLNPTQVMKLRDKLTDFLRAHPAGQPPIFWEEEE